METEAAALNSRPGSHGGGGRVQFSVRLVITHLRECAAGNRWRLTPWVNLISWIRPAHIVGKLLLRKLLGLNALGQAEDGSAVGLCSFWMFQKTKEMYHSENKGLVLGIMAGAAAAISFFLIWYHKVRKPRASIHLPAFLDFDNRFHFVGLQNETHNESGTIMTLHGRQLQVLEKLNGLVISVEELKREIKFLKEAIPKLEELVRDELQGKANAHRISPSHRATKKRKAETACGTPDNTSSEEAESEGGYITAHTDTEGESEEEKGWVISSGATVVRSEEETKLANLLQNVDHLHGGSVDDKKKSFRLLLEEKEQYGKHARFLWRLARAYGDMFEMTTDVEEKKKYVANGKISAGKAIQLDAMSAESHQWFAVMCGYMSEFESMQNKIKNGYLFKEHLDKAIELKPQDPFLYYLNGRWCYSHQKAKVKSEKELC
ncbi:regulator of microtubule dynamics protein 2 isoform X5 [Alligator mississippiensis]|uniref:regulator of microtubule dynamics protein 2 isoform X5 n=1 Tax=Alligator mississippiensis TaxID=8496 RepID=UPI0009075A91|nr:regulator of microtubule dynamics protein 2 isoform X5 [Alligator mississippiensis]